MTDPVIIERSELAGIARNAALLATEQVLRELGIRKGGFNKWITQNQAFRLASRRRIERAMKDGRIRWQKQDMNKKLSRVMVLRSDVEKLINHEL